MRYLYKVYRDIINYIGKSNFYYKRAFEMPQIISDKVIYLIGERSSPWLIVFNCPCGCKEIIQLNLLKDSTPCWKFIINKKGKVFITPSIWRTKGCKSHFLVKNSKTIWVEGYI